MSTKLSDQIVLNSLPSPVVILDNTGNILAVNGAWHRFTQGRQSLLGEAVFVGSNYLDEWVGVFAATANVPAKVLKEFRKKYIRKKRKESRRLML